MDSSPAYERVLDIVERNTCGPQPSVVEKDRVMLQLARSDVDPEAAESALQTAVKSGDLERAGRGYRPPGGCDC